jgi:hypothetical protein
MAEDLDCHTVVQQGRFLEQSLRSVLLQDYPNLEYLVLDGGVPTTRSKSWNDMLRTCRFGAVNGMPARPTPLATGFERATGEIFGYLNSDDILLPVR